MIFKIHVCSKQLLIQFIRVDLNVRFKINKTKYKSIKIFERALDKKQTTQK